MAKGNITLTVGFGVFLKSKLSYALCKKVWNTSGGKQKTQGKMFALYVWGVWNTEVSEKSHWSHHIVTHPLPSDCTAMSLSAMENGS